MKLVSGASFTGSRAGGTFVVDVPAGEYGQLFGRSEVVYGAPQATFRYQREKKERRGLSKPDIGLFLDKANATVLKARISFGLSSKDYVLEGASFERQRCVDLSTKGLRREVLY